MSLRSIFIPRFHGLHQLFGQHIQFDLKSSNRFWGFLQSSLLHNMAESKLKETAETSGVGNGTDRETKHEQDKGTLSKRAMKKLQRIEKWKQKEKKPKSRKPGATEPGFGADLYEETEYYYENGLRKVYPYYYTFTTYVKQRWIGRTVIDVFSSEFKAHSEQNYRSAIENGHLTANGNKISTDYVLKNNEFLAHSLHRHENPVIGCPIEVIVDTDDLIVINKPSSIPCHPCGKYRHNSVVFIVGRQMGCANLRNIYRLDRLTSGVLIMGKTSKKTKELEDQVLNRQVKKEYVSRVVGDFPGGKVDCKESIGVISQKLGLFRVRPDGKSCHTTFEKLSFNGKTSIVRCVPHTGRTHQIRVHLQYLGHPIVNDPFYNSEAWGPNRNKGGIMDRTDQEVSDRLMELHNIGHWTDGENPLYAARLQEIQSETTESHQVSETTESLQVSDRQMETEENRHHGSDGQTGASDSSGSGVPIAGAVHNDPTRRTTSELPEQSESEGIEPPSKKSRTDDNESGSWHTDTQALSETQEQHIPPFDRKKWIPDVNCQSCQLKYVDPTPKDLVMYLHALRYSGPDWEYSTPLPDWAEEHWTD